MGTVNPDEPFEPELWKPRREAQTEAGGSTRSAKTEGIMRL